MDVNRQEAKRLYQEEHLSTAQISERLSIKYETVKKWKQRDNWDKKQVAETGTGDGDAAKKSPRECKPGCRPPFQPGNQMSVVTGEHSRLFFDSLDPDEISFINSVALDKSTILQEELILLTVRERRMMRRISAQTSKKKPDAEIIQRIEEALTRVQTRKQNIVDQIHRIEYDTERLKIEKQRVGYEGQRISLGLAPEQNPDDGVVIINDLNSDSPAERSDRPEAI